jgi:hypothetical protein
MNLHTVASVAESPQESAGDRPRPLSGRRPKTKQNVKRHCDICFLFATDLPCYAMALRACTVSVVGLARVRHSVDVTAESLYEAAVLGVKLLAQDHWVGTIAPGTQVEVQVRPPAMLHVVTVAELRRWVDAVGLSPDETLRKRKLRALLQSAIPTSLSTSRRSP